MNRLLRILRHLKLASRTWRVIDGRRVYGWRCGPAGWFRAARPRKLIDRNQGQLFKDPPDGAGKAP